MRKNIVRDSCNQAAKHLPPFVELNPTAPEYPVLTFINAFRLAIGENPLSPQAASVDQAVRDVFLYTSTDFRGTLQVKQPRVWAGLVALLPAAGQLQSTEFMPI